MPKARKKKNSSFETDVTKSVLLYGQPNTGKLCLLTKMHEGFRVLVNEGLLQRTDITLQLVKNDKKDTSSGSWKNPCARKE